MTDRRRIMRILSREIPCIMIGIILTFATAWLAILLSNCGTPSAFESSPPQPLRHTAHDLGASIQVASPALCMRAWHNSNSAREETTCVWELSAGFPTRSCASYAGHVTWTTGHVDVVNLFLRELEFSWLNRGLARTNLDLNAWRQMGYPDVELGYPLLPLWPGFAINTATYATLTWLVVCVPTWLRARRSRRALCPKCAYDIRTLPTCPECGTTRTN